MGEVGVGVISAIIALIAAFVTIYYSSKTLHVSALSARMQYFSELREWAREVGEVLSEAVHLCEIDSSIMPRRNFQETQHSVKIRLSSLIDQGRLFFPNITTTNHGLDKEKAFQGHRHRVLDVMVFTYKRVSKMKVGQCPLNEQLKSEIVAYKRDFISEIQATLDPRTLSKEFAAISGLKAMKELDKPL